MSRSEGSLGWEVWFLLALVAAGGSGAGFMIINVIITVALGVPGPNGGSGTALRGAPAPLSADRAVVGLVGATMFVGLAIWSVWSMRRLDRGHVE